MLKYCLTETKLFSDLFYSFLKNYSTSASNILREAFYIIIFKLCKFNVNLWTLCFVSYKKYPDPLTVVYWPNDGWNNTGPVNIFSKWFHLGPISWSCWAENTAWQNSLLSKNWVGHQSQRCHLLAGNLFLLSINCLCLASFVLTGFIKL